jgi:single-stranded DNA-specific DHH superfamily exonuclease
MLTKKQVKEIMEHLDKAQNPLFFFDNDQDGLCSFLLLQRYLGRGKGIPIRSFPEMNAGYFRRVRELGADYIFILDKPLVSDQLFKEVEQVNIPLVWIDHHEIQVDRVPEFVSYYNPLYNKNKTDEPVTALCYQVANQKNDSWLAFIGCVSDNFIPDFYNEFRKKYPDLIDEKMKNALDIFYKSEIGKIGRIFGFALKDRITNVVKMLKFLMKVKTPYEVLEKSNENYFMHERFDFVNKKYQRLIEKAKACKDEKILFFEYGGDLSISGDLANGLRCEFPDKIVIVVYINGIKANISARGKNVKKIVLEAIKNLEGARGGGHRDAVGAQVRVGDVEKFRKKIFGLIK